MAEATLAATHDEKIAVLYRMVMSDHVYPYGLKTKHLLESRGYSVEDHHLKTRQETDDFQSIDLFLFHDSFQSVRPELVEGLATNLS